jgi:hypothetical protein
MNNKNSNVMIAEFWETPIIDPPEWEFYEGIKLEDLVIQYVRKDAK